MINHETTFIPFPLKDFQRMKEDISFLRSQLSNANKASSQKEWLTRLEFLAACSIGSTQFNILKNQGKLHLNYIGKKVYVHHSCVDQYFAGNYKK
ncbi:MAG: hypothetical protein RIA69_08840 [Cyclobacteriaceae bacterium]